MGRTVSFYIVYMSLMSDIMKYMFLHLICLLLNLCRIFILTGYVVGKAEYLNSLSDHCRYFCLILFPKHDIISKGYLKCGI